MVFPLWTFVPFVVKYFFSSVTDDLDSETAMRYLS
jgi:hypothetical protein